MSSTPAIPESLKVKWLSPSMGKTTESVRIMIEKFIQSGSSKLEVSFVTPEIEDLQKKIKDLEERLDKYWIYGSDACRNCKDGRITLYAKTGWCIECLNQNEGAL